MKVKLGSQFGFHRVLVGIIVIYISKDLAGHKKLVLFKNAKKVISRSSLAAIFDFT